MVVIVCRTVGYFYKSVWGCDRVARRVGSFCPAVCESMSAAQLFFHVYVVVLDRSTRYVLFRRLVVSDSIRRKGGLSYTFGVE